MLDRLVTEAGAFEKLATQVTGQEANKAAVFLEKIEDQDDVQNVYSNVELLITS